MARRDINHSYPHCWRCKRPTIFRATDQWFVSMDATGLRAAALDAIENDVAWYPAHASKRIGSMVEGRPDWCISRQRNWGVPIPSYTCADCGEKVMNDATLDAVIALFREKGSDAWFTDEPAELPGRGLRLPLVRRPSTSRPTRDILDVWWDSGVSWDAVCEHPSRARPIPPTCTSRAPTSTAAGSRARCSRAWARNGKSHRTSAVVSQGFTLDGQGRKMSKSLGNVIDPNKVCDEMGADIIRLWVASVDTSTDVSIDHEILKRTSDAYRRFRNTFRFLLSELYDSSTRDATALAVADLLPRRHARARPHERGPRQGRARPTRATAFNGVYRALYDYVVTELSNVYLDVLKDRTYCDAPALAASAAAPRPCSPRIL